MTALAYVDASALTKLILEEPSSAAVRRWYIESDRVTCSIIGVIETRRAALRHPHDSAHLDAVMRSVVTLEVDDFVTQQAAVVGPATLRTLDAIHLATALTLGPELDAFVTYDDRLADAARAVGLPVVRPA